MTTDRCTKLTVLRTRDLA